MVILLSTGCTKSEEQFNKTVFFPSAQIAMKTKPSFFVNSAEKVTFTYGQINIASFCYKGTDTDNIWSVRTFPFTAEEYQDHFKSPFSDFSSEITETYALIETDNPYISKCYRSVARTTEKLYDTVYLIEFVGSDGCLILKNTGKNKDYGSHYLNTLTPVLSYKEKEPVSHKAEQEINDITAIQTEENVLFNLPADFSYYKEQTDNFCRIVGNGPADNYLCLDVSDMGLIPSNSDIWAYNYGFDRTSDGKIYNINTNKLYYINEWESSISTLQGERLVRFSYIDTINQSDYLDEIRKLNFIEE